jgi:hypothetical protein
MTCLPFLIDDVHSPMERGVGKRSVPTMERGVGVSPQRRCDIIPIFYERGGAGDACVSRYHVGLVNRSFSLTGSLRTSPTAV